MMEILSLSKAAELKKELQTNFGVNLHVRDSCAGQSFTLDKSSDAVAGFISGFFNKANMDVKFSDDRQSFAVRQKSG